MPYTRLTARSVKDRILIAGAPNTGKTYSLSTFIYGQYADIPEREHEALEYAGDKSMVILNCPGEKGVKSLPVGQHITSMIYETDARESSVQIMKGFEDLTYSIALAAKVPDVLVIDGIHSLYNYWMDALSVGQFFKEAQVINDKGVDDTGKTYGKCHVMFGNYLNNLFHSKVPTIVVTTWEEWENRDDNMTVEQRKYAVKYLYPALPGKMAKAVIGNFDCTLSARLERKCTHPRCSESQSGKEHYVWQFLPKGDVRGVGIKGLRKVTQEMRDRPYIHQNYATLQNLVAKCQ